MPEFVLDTSGGVPVARKLGEPEGPCTWAELDAFTQGYIEALFFTSGDPCGSFNDGEAGENDDLTAVRGFSDLAPETLAAIIEDCREFQKQTAPERDNGSALWRYLEHGRAEESRAKMGRDFWYTRNGHGAGFWDGDWPEPYASQLTTAAKDFHMQDAYLGDDGKVYLS